MCGQVLAQLRQRPKTVGHLGEAVHHEAGQKVFAVGFVGKVKLPLIWPHDEGGGAQVVLQALHVGRTVMASK